MKKNNSQLSTSNFLQTFSPAGRIDCQCEERALDNLREGSTGAKSALLDFAPLGQNFPALRLSSNQPSLLRHFSSLHSESAYAKSAFSLAEVLTTLMLIGVVAAILVPALYININNQKNVAALKRMYSDFSINIQTVLNYYNCSSISCTRKYGKIGAQRTPDGKFVGPHNGVFADPTIIKLARECPECFVKNSIMPVDMITIKDSFENRAGVRTPVVLPANFTAYQFDTGSAMGLFDYPGNCVHTGGVTYTGGRIWRCPSDGRPCYWDIANNDPMPICGIVVFDTNGAKKPNLPGKDRFAYYIMDEPLDDSYLVPVGYSFDDDNPRNKSKFNKNGFIRSEMAGNKCIPNDKSGQGYNCTAKVMLNNWKINY